MRLLVDVGNSTVHAGLGDGGRVLREARFVTRDRGDFASFLDRFLRGFRPRVRDVGIASVDPAALDAARAALESLAVPVRIVGADLHVPLPNPYDDPRQLGIDRLVDAWAVHRRFEGDRIVVDFGTAITVDALTVDEEGRPHFHSGAILPGFWLSLHALSTRAAQLPPIESVDHEALPTRGTEAAMVAGLRSGIPGLVDRVAEDLASAVGIEPRVVATGGDARRFAERCRLPVDVVPSLTLLGILDLLESAACAASTGRASGLDPEAAPDAGSAP